MAASASDLAKSIQPDSTQYGDRKSLEAGLGAAVGAGGPAPSGGAASAAPPLDSSRDPMAALLSGDLNPGGGDVPLTDGLGVGPGMTPGAGQQDSRESRLRQLAQSAQTPLLRAAARSELRASLGRPV